MPAYRERAGEVDNGRLTVRSADDIAELYRTHAASQTAHGPTVATRIPSEPLTAEDAWARTLVAEIAEFAATHNRPQPLVRVTLADGEQFFLASLEPRPGDGFVTLYPHPQQAADLVAGTEGAVMVPRSVVVPLSSIRKVELLTHVPRGTRSNVGFLLPPGDLNATDATCLGARRRATDFFVHSPPGGETARIRRPAAELAMTEQGPIDDQDPKRRRRRFGIVAAALGALLLLAGTLLASRDGVLEAVGIVCLAYGIGLLVAGASLSLGHNPLDRRKR